MLAQNLLRVPWGRTSIIGFANYVLGFGHIRTNMDLQQATSLATTLKKLPPSQAGASAVAALVETCRDGEAWRVDPEAAALLRRELAAGELPAQTRPLVTRVAVPARVLVVLPGRRPAAKAYVDEVRRRLAASAGAPVEVKAITVAAWSRLAARTVAAARSWRPLAVLVGPPATPSPGAEAEALAALRVLGVALRVNTLPAVVSEPLPVEATGTVAPDAADLDAALVASRQPVSPLAVSAASASTEPTAVAQASPGALVTAPSPASSTAAARARRAARANVATLVRACWPGALAPRLASTRLGFSFAARRRTEVVVAAPTADVAARYESRLRVWGFEVGRTTGDTWRSDAAGARVLYAPGSRRAALSLAGDLGLPAAAVVVDADAAGAPGAPRQVSVRRSALPGEGASSYACILVSGSGGQAATQIRSASDETQPGPEDQDDLATGERELAALFAGSLQAREIVLESRPGYPCTGRLEDCSRCTRAQPRSPRPSSCRSGCRPPRRR